MSCSPQYWITLRFIGDARFVEGARHLELGKIPCRFRGYRYCCFAVALDYWDAWHGHYVVRGSYAKERWGMPMGQKRVVGCGFLVAWRWIRETRQVNEACPGVASGAAAFQRLLRLVIYWGHTQQHSAVQGYALARRAPRSGWVRFLKLEG